MDEAEKAAENRRHHETDPEYYEGKLSEEASQIRATLESELEDLYASQRDATGVNRLKLTKQIDALEETLAWQGANPKHIPIKELREHIRSAHNDDGQVALYRSKIKNRATAIRAFCVNCMGGDTVGVRQCPSITCPLHPFRMGKDPLRGWDIPKMEMPEIETDDEDVGEFEDGDEGDTDAN